MPNERSHAEPDPFKTIAPGAIGFGVVPGSPEEARAHVQSRIRAYVGLFAILWFFLFFGQFLVRSWGDKILLRNALTLGVAGIHLGLTVALGLSWYALGRGQYSLRALELLDGVLTLLQAFGMAAMLFMAGEPKYRTELVIMLGLTNLLAGRAAVVPCTASRTGLLGALALLPQPLVTYWLFRTKEVPPEFPGAIGVAAFVTMWGALAALLSVAITRIIYGLERRVKHARQLGQYTLEKPVGVGGMGMVYLARHALLRRPTAIKLLKPDKAGKDALKRFEREVQLTSQLTHPNIVAIYDYGRTPDGVFYYAMEYLEGVDLERLVKEQGRLPASRVKHIIRQTADALAEAHSVKLIHRDIKPANIVVLSRGRQHDLVKVCDFGLVKDVRPDAHAPSMSNVSTLIGTPLYISPESITNPTKVDHRSDIYALGAVAYYLLTGSPVVKGRSLVEVCAWHMYEKPEPPSARIAQPIAASLEKLVLRCLEKDPTKRPQSAAEVVEALDSATDVPGWTSADASGAWEGIPSARRTMGPHGDDGDGAEDQHTPEPASRALPVDLLNR